MPQSPSPSTPDANASKVNPATLEFIKQNQARRRKQRAIASVVGLVLVAGISIGGYLGYTKYKTSHQVNVAKQLAAEIKPGQGREGFQKLREAVEAGTITEDQAREAGRAAFEKEQQARVEGYFKTPAKDRDKYLDSMIDEMQKRMAEWQRDRPTTGPTTRPNGPRNGGPATRPNGQGGPGGPGGRGQQRADNTSPVQRAQQSEFRAAMQARMKARGIQMPGGGRGWGGGGGGRGGRG